MALALVVSPCLRLAPVLADVEEAALTLPEELSPRLGLVRVEDKGEDGRV